MRERKYYSLEKLSVGNFIVIEAETYKEQCKIRAAVSSFARYHERKIIARLKEKKITITRLA